MTQNRFIIQEELSQVTIIMFTRNRFDMATNVIDFWHDRGASIMVLDGSNEKILESYCKNLEAVDYFGAVPLYERALYASQSIKTKFAIIQSDDSLIMPKGINSAISALEQEKDISFVYSPRNFSRWYLESGRNEHPNYLAQTSLERICAWSKNPTDVLWGALWRTHELKTALNIMGNSAKAIPFETALTIIALYIVGLFLGKGRYILEPIHLTRHWDAPIDDSLIRLRTARNPYGLELNEEGSKYLIDWKENLYSLISNLIDVDKELTKNDLYKALDNYSSNETNLGTNREASFRIKALGKIVLTLHRGQNQRFPIKVIATIFLKGIKKYRLLYNKVYKIRMPWCSSELLEQFREDEISKLGIEVQKLKITKLSSYEKIFRNQC